MSEAVERLMTAMRQAQETRPVVGAFPYLAEHLRRAGALRNVWHLPACQSLFLTELGPVVMQGEPLIKGVVDVPAFDEEAFVKALRADQAGKTTLPEFLRGVWEAGVVEYVVDFTERTVTYRGAMGAEYVEEYPAVDVA